MLIDTMSAHAITVYALSLIIYAGAVVPYCTGRILVKYAESLRFWYYFVLLLSMYGLVYILFKYRNRLLLREKSTLLIFLFGYAGICSPLFLPIGGLPKVAIPEVLFYAYILAICLLGLAIIPWYGAKILSKALGKSEGYWIIILVLLNCYALIYILIKYRKQLSRSEKRKLIYLLLGYFAGVVLIMLGDLGRLL